MALTTIPSELSSVSGISDSSTSTAITINSSQEVTFAGNITTGSNTISGVLSSVTGSLGSAATATTQAASDNTTKIATTAYVTTALANMVDSAPSTLDTLNELAAALGDDANFSTTVTNSIATKLPLAGGTLTGNLVVSTTSPQIQFQTSSSHYNWQLAAQENVSGAFEISSGAQDADATNDTYTPRLVIDSSGNVGIGTVSPSAMLEVDTATVSANPGFRVRRNHGGQAFQQLSGLSFYWNTSNGSQDNSIVYGASANSYLSLVHATGSAFNERVRIDASGNVGIGTSPSAPLHLETGTTTDILRFGAGGRWGFQRANSDSRYVSFSRAMNGTAQAVFTVDGDNGRVGIGTPSPANDFVVKNGSNVDIEFGSESGGGFIQTYNRSTSAYGYLRFVTSGETMRLDANGNVGIGTQSPGAVRLNAVATASGNLAGMFTNTHATGSYGVKIQAGSSSSNYSLAIADKDNATTHFYFRGDGNLGIGETAPDGKLHVRGGSSAGGQIWIQTDGTFAGTDEAQLNFRHYDDTGDASGQIKLIGTTTGGNYSGDMVFSVRGGGTSGAGGATLSEKMRITNDGRVGIGTTNPVVQFAVGGAGRRVEIDGASGVIRGYDRTSSWAAIDFEASGYTFDVSTARIADIDSDGIKMATGKGIKFDAYGSGNILDDYEEGTYNTAFYTSSSGSIALSSNTLAYTKVGRLVTVSGFCVVSSVSSPVGYLYFTLPFAMGSGNQFAASASVSFNGVASGAVNDAWAFTLSGSTQVRVYVGSSSGASATFAQRVTAGTDVRISVTYSTA